MVNNWLKNILDILFPRTCVLCDAPGVDDLDLCPGCLADLPRPDNACPRCGGSVLGATAESVCGRCLQRPPAFHAAHSLFQYAPPVDYLIHQLKFAGDIRLAEMFACLLARHLSLLPRPDRVIPVPLHPKRLRARGFNQSVEIARYVCRYMQVPLDFKNASRTRHTAEQSSLSARKRRANVRHAFSYKADLTGKHVAIVDDVMTTGHTVDEFARILAKAGAEHIQVWVVARAGK